MTTAPDLRTLTWTKGHGTQNDFVLVPDPEGDLRLTPDLVAAVCDRHAGIGADGLIRVVRSAALAEGLALAGESEWFMDYSNADGSVAEMCGNGIRVFVRYLLREGLIELEDGESVPVGTRNGVLPVRRDGELLCVDLGAWHVSGTDPASAVLVTLPGEPVGLPGLSVDVGNPHVVVAVPDGEALRRADLGPAPELDPLPPHGANVEVVLPMAPGEEYGRLAMRVHERGSGETRSCGTGAAAAVLAARAWAGQGAPEVWWVDVPGGRLRVTTPAATDAGSSVELAGPAVLVADGVLDVEQLTLG